MSKQMSLMIPEWIDKSPEMLKELSLQDRTMVMEIINKAKALREQKMPLGSFISKEDKNKISNAISTLQEVDLEDDDDSCSF